MPHAAPSRRSLPSPGARWVPRGRAGEEIDRRDDRLPAHVQLGHGSDRGDGEVDALVAHSVVGMHEVELHDPFTHRQPGSLRVGQQRAAIGIGPMVGVDAGERPGDRSIAQAGERIGHLRGRSIDEVECREEPM